MATVPVSSAPSEAQTSHVRTVKVGNISLAATEHDIREFFTFSGEIIYVDIKSETERSQLAYVTFKEEQGAHTALLLSGATIIDMTVNISLSGDYQLPPEAFTSAMEQRKAPVTDATAKTTEDVVVNMLAKGFVLGKDALTKAKSFDERHQLISNASARFSSLDQKIGLTEKVKGIDERFQVSEKTKSAIAIAEQKANSLMSNPYVSSGAAWVSSTINKVATAAEEVSKEKVVSSKVEDKGTTSQDTGASGDGHAKVEDKGIALQDKGVLGGGHIQQSGTGEEHVITLNAGDEKKSGA